MSVVRIAHLSDPHFGTIAPGVQDGLLETLLTLKTDLVLLTGDITQRARHRQFAQAHRFAENIREILPESAVIAVPGNHDIPLFNTRSFPSLSLQADLGAGVHARRNVDHNLLPRPHFTCTVACRARLRRHLSRRAACRRSLRLPLHMKMPRLPKM